MDQTITISSNEISEINEKQYSISERKIIASRIDKISDKRILGKIFKIIHDNHMKYTQNQNSVTINLTNLSSNIIARIEKYLNLYDNALSKKIANKTEQKWSERLETQLNSESAQNENNNEKLSGQEKLFLRKMAPQNDVVYWNGS